MIIICPIHNIQYNPDTNPQCAICLLHPSTQESEIKKLKKFKAQDERAEIRKEKNTYRYEASNKKRREQRSIKKTIKQRA